MSLPLKSRITLDCPKPSLPRSQTGNFSYTGLPDPGESTGPYSDTVGSRRRRSNASLTALERRLASHFEVTDLSESRLLTGQRTIPTIDRRPSSPHGH